MLGVTHGDALAVRLDIRSFGHPRQTAPRLLDHGRKSLGGVLLLSTIAQKFRMTLAPGYRVELLPSITLRPKHGVHARLTRR